MTSFATWLGVALLGGVGAVLRFALDGAVGARTDGELPLGTLVVNVSGSLCLGLLTGLHVTGDALLLLGTATLGSFTTFSTLVLETERLAEDGQGRLALANVCLSLAGGLGAAAAGWAIGALL
jgi:CrcB protein